MTITKRDIRNIIIIGALVGLLVQPVIINIGAEKIGSILPAPILALPFLVLQVAAFLAFVILAPVALYIASIVARFVPVVYQIAKFGAVGSLNSFVDFGVLNTLLFFFLSSTQAGPLYKVFVGISFLAATTNSYIWNKAWTFNSGEKVERSPREAITFYAITTLVFLVHVSVADYVVNTLGPSTGFSPALWANVGKLFGIFSGMTFNFLSYKFIVFRKKPPVAPSVVTP